MRRAARLALGCVLLLGGIVDPVPAGAAAARGSVQRDGAAVLAATRDRVIAAIDRRVQDLSAARAALDRAAGVPGAHRSGLDAELDADMAGLQRLRGGVTAAPDVAAVRSSAKAVVDDYRVYALELPKVHQVIAADSIVLASSRLQDVTRQVGRALDAEQASGVDVTTRRAAAASVTSSLDSVTTSSSGRAQALLALTPSGYPESAATLRTARAAERADREAVRVAKDRLATLVHEIGGGPTATTTSVVVRATT